MAPKLPTEGKNCSENLRKMGSIRKGNLSHYLFSEGRRGAMRKCEKSDLRSKKGSGVVGGHFKGA